jgi:hypothetical protein
MDAILLSRKVESKAATQPVRLMAGHSDNNSDELGSEQDPDSVGAHSTMPNESSAAAFLAGVKFARTQDAERQNRRQKQKQMHQQVSTAQLRSANETVDDATATASVMKGAVAGAAGPCSPGDSKLTATPPAIAHRFELDEVSEADIDLCPVDKAIEMVAEVTEAEARVPAEAEHAEAATAPKQYSYALEDIQKPEGWGFLEGHDLGVHPEGGDLGMRGDILLQWEDS